MAQQMAQKRQLQCWDLKLKQRCFFFFIDIKPQMGESAINVILCEIVDQWI